jgi:hypothetical protein
VVIIAHGERYRITEKLERLNELGFDVDEVNLVPTEGGGRLQLKIKIGGRNFHSSRLKGLTGIDALERQARQILSDLAYYQAQAGAYSKTDKAVAAVRWRVSRFEPLLEQLRNTPGVQEPIQAYCDLLHHRYLKSVEGGHDIGTEAAMESWRTAGMPGYMPPSSDG